MDRNGRNNTANRMAQQAQGTDVNPTQAQDQRELPGDRVGDAASQRDIASPPARQGQRWDSRWTILLGGCLIALATLAAYANSFQGVFVFDDEASIVNNSTIRHLWPLWRPLAPPHNGETVSGRPLLNLTFAVNYALGPLNPWGYHVVNLLIHILAALSLFGVMRRTFVLIGIEDCRTTSGAEKENGSRADVPESISDNSPFLALSPSPTCVTAATTGSLPYAATLLAVCIVLLWALHPLQTESVTYIAQRAESLCGLFYLLTLYCVIRGATADEDSSIGSCKKARRARSDPQSVIRNPFFWYSAAALACLLGMATKEIMLTAPVMTLLYDRLFLARSFGGALRRRWALYTALAATWGLLAWLMLSSGLLGTSVGYGAPEAVQSWDYLRSQPAVILHYLRLTIWPHPLCLDYGRTALASALFGTLAAVIVTTGFLATFWGLARGKRWAMLGVWVLLILAPSSLVPLRDVAFEHRMYLPLAAVATAVGLVVYCAGRTLLPYSATARPAMIALAVCLPLAACTALGIRTYTRNAIYLSRLSLWQDAVAHAPGNERAHNNLANVLREQKRLEEAITQYQQALAIKPDYAFAQSNLGNALLKQGKVAEAMRYFREAIHNDPKLAAAYLNLGHVLELQGKPVEAIAYYREALRIQPDYRDASYNLGVALGEQGKAAEAAAQYRKALEIDNRFAPAYYNLGVVLEQQGRTADAAAQYTAALAANPNYAEAHHNLGSILAREGKLSEAVAHYQTTLALRPDIAEARRNLATALYNQGKTSLALAQWRRLIGLQPEAIRDLNTLAWILATDPDPSVRNGSEAVEFARRAAQLCSGCEPAILDTLAAAYAETGRFTEAVRVAQEASRLARQANDTALVDKIALRIKSYQAAAPYHTAR